MLRQVQIADPASRDAALSAPALRRDAAARRDRDGARRPTRRCSCSTSRRRVSTRRSRRRCSTSISELQAEFHTAVLFISHNLGVIAQDVRRGWACSTPGELVEEGTAEHGAARPPASVHGRPAALHPARRRAQGPRPARHDPRLPAADRRRSPGLRVRRPLRAGRGHLPAREAAAVPGRRAATSAAASSTSRRAGAAARHGRRSRGAPADRSRAASPCCSIDDLAKIFHQGGRDIHALAGVSAAHLARRDARARRRVRARARRPSRVRCSASSSPPRGAVSVDGRVLPPTLRGTHPRGRRGRCRSSSRTRTPPSIAATRVRRILRRSLRQLSDVTGKAADERIRELIGGRAPARPRDLAAPPRSSRAARSSASRSRARSRASRGSSSATSPPPPSTCPCRRRS